MYNTLAELFAAIADAIREKSGTTDKINAQDFPAKILEINSNKTLVTGTIDEKIM